MKLLLAGERPPYPLFLGGAARCAHKILTHLAQSPDVTCAAVGSAQYSVTPWTIPDEKERKALGIRSIHSDSDRFTIDCGYPIHLIANTEQVLDQLIDEYKPDLIWTQLEGAQAILERARHKGIQGLYYVHDAEFKPNEIRAITATRCHMVCCSGFLAKKIYRTVGRSAHVVYPPAERYFDTVGAPDGYVTMINPVNVKGQQTFLEIAKRLPKIPFLLVESWKLSDRALQQLMESLAALPNVRFMRRVSDMRTIYSQTRLLLVPSIWEEGFGMVAIEAQSAGIPVIASARGGLPESVGDGGVLIKDYTNPQPWVQTITDLFANVKRYNALASAAIDHARSPIFEPHELARRFLAICQHQEPAHRPILQFGTRKILGAMSKRSR